MKSCNINLACFTLTDLRYFFEMILSNQIHFQSYCFIWMLRMDMLLLTFLLLPIMCSKQSNHIIKFFEKSNWTTFAPFSKTTSGPEHFWLWMGKKVRYWIHFRVSFRRSNAPIQRETTSHTKIVNAYAWTMIIHTFSLSLPSTRRFYEDLCCLLTSNHYCRWVRRYLHFITSDNAIWIF